jgi:hypothetical protein
MEILATLLNAVAGIGRLICLILVWAKMFQHGRSTLAIVCIVLSCCGIGVLGNVYRGRLKTWKY